ncbi:MAG: hypothetical protein ACXVIG_06305 [Halobacteriota archaeon]
MDLNDVEFKVKTALETAYCYYNLHHECDKGLSMPSRTDCKSCMVEAFENIVRSNGTGTK